MDVRVPGQTPGVNDVRVENRLNLNLNSCRRADLLTLEFLQRMKVCVTRN